MEAVFGMHNWPGMQVGELRVSPGPVMASSNEFKITIRGKGSHAAMPHLGVDPVPVACQMVQAFQTIITPQQEADRRRRDLGHDDPRRRGHQRRPRHRARSQGTVRTFTLEVLDLIEKRMRQIAEHTCAAFGATVRIPSSCATTRRRSITPPRPSSRASVMARHRRRRQRAWPSSRRWARRTSATSCREARLLLRHRQRRRQPPRRRPRHRPVHAAQPELRLQRRPDSAGRARSGCGSPRSGSEPPRRRVAAPKRFRGAARSRRLVGSRQGDHALRPRRDPFARTATPRRARSSSRRPPARRLESHPEPLRGIDGEALAMDVARIGAADADSAADRLQRLPRRRRLLRLRRAGRAAARQRVPRRGAPRGRRAAVRARAQSLRLLVRGGGTRTRTST